jgi:D-sedoheptulose 7-phosphate isomerase
MATQCALALQIEQRLLARNQIYESFFAREASRLAEACRQMSNRFLRGGRLPASVYHVIRETLEVLARG